MAQGRGNPKEPRGPHEVLRGAACYSSEGVDVTQAKTRGGGCTKARRSRVGDSTLRGRLRIRGRVRGCCKPGDQGVDVAQAKTRGEGVHKGWVL